MKKVRNYITPSSLGSYFGVGFLSPEEQIEIDLGNEEQYFDEEAQARLMLGRNLEDAALNYFEEALGIVIDERNDQLINFYDNKMKGKIDGMTMFNGVKTVVENKISNSKSYKFTDNLGYHFQVQSYMLATDTEQALLCGLYQGKPIYKVIPRDEEMIADIKTMADFVYDMLMGFETWDNFPYHLVTKYSKKTPLEDIENITEEEVDLLAELADLKEEKSNLDKEIKVIENQLKEKWKTGKYENDRIKLTISEVHKRGAVDIDRLSIEHPEIDYDSYIKQDTVYRSLRVVKK
jgi:predicted phage-related endonuclease